MLPKYSLQYKFDNCCIKAFIPPEILPFFSIQQGLLKYEYSNKISCLRSE